MPFRADLFLEPNAIAQQGSTDEVFVELADNVELPSARDALVYRFPGGLYLGGIARLTRSIMVVQTVGLVEEFWEPSAGSESEVTEDPHSETAYSRAHRLARSIECADALVVDRMPLLLKRREKSYDYYAGLTQQQLSSMRVLIVLKPTL